MDDIRIARATTAAEIGRAAGLFDHPPRADATERFLGEAGHHLLIAWLADGAVGFVSGAELTHPDKGTEMFVYELGVAERTAPAGSDARSSARSPTSRATQAATGCGFSPTTTIPPRSRHTAQRAARSNRSPG